jgi:hypothetical protein
LNKSSCCATRENGKKYLRKRSLEMSLQVKKRLSMISLE